MPKMMLMVSLSLKGRVVKEFTFAKDSLVIGRDPEADIFLDNTGVSRRHAKIEWTSKGYFVEDLGSANGTFLNDEEIERHILDEDDVVPRGLAVGPRLGDHHAVLQKVILSPHHGAEGGAPEREE